MRLSSFLMICFISIICTASFGQKLLSGTILDERNIPIPFAKIYAKNNAELRTVADAKGYYELRLFVGEYFLVINSTGYLERETYVMINDQDIIRDVQLFPATVKDLEDIEVSAKKSNPGREIMLKVVKKRDQINPWNNPHSV